MLTATQFKEIYSRYQSTGLSIRAFCLNEGINESKFHYWKKRLQRIFPVSHGFIPLKIEKSKPELAPPAFNSVFRSLSGNEDGNCNFEITYPNGTRLKFSGVADYELVKSLLLLNR
jgi:putative transposase